MEAMTLMEKKYSTKDFDKGTDELADTKQTAVKIRRKCIYQFEGQYKGSKVWFKLDSGVLKPYLLQFIQNSINTLKNNIEYQDTELYTTFILLFDEEFINTNYEKETKHDLSIRSTSAIRNRIAQT